MAKVELKQPVVSEIKELLDGAESAVVVDYRGISVAQDTELRKKLREAGISYKVYKNTMIRFAAKGTAFEALDPNLEGPTAIAVSKTDATAPARILAEFAKTAPALEIKGGVVEGNYYDAKGMEKISGIPSRDILLGRLLGSIQSPITNFARVLKQIADAQGGEAAEA
ncbi:MAG TPA: 50S ribosomal protein L10 [Lachnoclostridium sp.]|jgi:large subunit ribosomal protein L10|uniref:50S ribosomal protein L10 n=1 Tax=Lacrimispora sp. TaxID=2719234 RepID=UPI000EE55D68|nr:50S ribosomal protein L10 [Lacrimispora sp.]HCD45056.1 50S ribosomal protein L10 [Lachnoclostridium sp.]